MTKDTRAVPLSLAAQRLSLSWAAGWRLVLTGKLRGRRVRGRWLVSRASLDALLRERNRTHKETPARGDS